MHGVLAILTQLAGPFFAFATPLVGYAIAHQLKPQNHERALALSIIAADAAQLIVIQSKGQPWAVQLSRAITAIATAAGVPTTNEEAIKRAATAALLRAGVSPAS